MRVMNADADNAGAADAAGQLAAAEAARARGDFDAVRAALVAAFADARAAGDGEAMAAAALSMPTSQRFGVHPGQIPALLFEAYEATEEIATRCRLAAALARSWVYGGDAARAARFADDAMRLSAEAVVPEVAADALDAALLAHWGPDDFSERLSLAARLDEVAAHVADTEVRLSAHLWRLTTAWECLDIVAVQRQLRALDVLADESGSERVAFFAASRRAMHALTTDDLVSADRYIARTVEIGSTLAEPDVYAVVHELRAMHKRMTGDAVGLRDEAAAAEVFGSTEGIPSVSALAADLWLAAGDPARAALIAGQLTTTGVADIARDVDYLLTLSLTVGVAAAVGMADVAREGAAALEPFAGRAVINAGAVTFYGIVDDYLFRAHTAAADPDADRWCHSARTAYRRIGASWWDRALGTPPPRRSPAARSVMLRREDTGRWTVGDEHDTFALADLKGLHYLRHLVARPGVDLEVLSLSDAVAGHPGTDLRQGDTGDVLDASAVAAYRRRLDELDAALDVADSQGDQHAAEAAAAERDALLEQLRGATGLGGRVRRRGASAERARIAIRKAIAATIIQIEGHDPSLARILRDSVHTGSACRYDPNPDLPITWLTR
jgi:hypothetical protein